MNSSLSGHSRWGEAISSLLTAALLLHVASAVILPARARGYAVFNVGHDGRVGPATTLQTVRARATVFAHQPELLAKPHIGVQWFSTAAACDTFRSAIERVVAPPRPASPRPLRVTVFTRQPPDARRHQ